MLVRVEKVEIEKDRVVKVDAMGESKWWRGGRWCKIQQNALLSWN